MATYTTTSAVVRGYAALVRAGHTPAEIRDAVEAPGFDMSDIREGVIGRLYPPSGWWGRCRDLLTSSAFTRHNRTVDSLTGERFGFAAARFGFDIELLTVNELAAFDGLTAEWRRVVS